MENEIRNQGRRKDRSIEIGRLIILVGMMLVINGSFMPLAQAQANDAGNILKRMSDYMSSQKSLPLTFDTDIEVITHPFLSVYNAGSSKEMMWSSGEQGNGLGA